ncbi:hypothetical protein E1A91_D09G098400v1 [Gossypium mustelinum]|uniref:Uncharacterized protein n=1 Tax=Gossypium mustelinum TaxID=34275 RepID=A0A5D2THG9_GOSMU|nr:hypothetical protein E1A91_D09G098400v1 [Gossypium mustelinum]
MDLKVGVEKDGAAVGAKLLQKQSWKERALAFANNGFRQPLGLDLHVPLCFCFFKSFELFFIFERFRV